MRCIYSTNYYCCVWSWTLLQLWQYMFLLAVYITLRSGLVPCVCDVFYRNQKECLTGDTKHILTAI